MQHRSPSGQGVGGRARRRGNDQSVSALVGNKMASYLNTQLDHARGRAPINHYVVHRKSVIHAHVVSHHAGIHERPMVFFELPLQHGSQSVLIAVQRNISNKTQAALVNANQRCTVRRQLASDAEHGAIAAYDQAKITLLTNLIGR